MKSVKLLIILLLSALFMQAQTIVPNYMQPMGYFDYSFYGQANFGNGKYHLTAPSAYIELGDSLRSRKGLLFPRGNKDSVTNPVRGLVFFDIPSGKLHLYDGSAWSPLGAGSGSVTGSGTGGYLARWNSNSSLNNSIIQDNGSNVGIAIAPSPGYKLRVNGNGFYAGNLMLGGLQHFGTGPNDYKMVVDSTGLLKAVPDAAFDTSFMATHWYVNNKIDSVRSELADSMLFDATTPSTSGIIGLNGVTLGTTTIKSTLQELIYPALPPTASLTVTYDGSTATNFNLEYMAAGADLPVTLNWTAGRQSNTALLSTIDVDGGLQSFSQPSQGASVSGSLSKTMPRNTTKIFHSDITATDGKVAYGNSVINWYYKRYWGFVNSTNPSDVAIRGGGQEFINERTQPPTGNYSPTGSQFYFIAFPEAYDPSNFSQIWIGGLNQTASFTRTVRSFTNASGATTNYILYVSKNMTSGAVSHEIK